MISFPGARRPDRQRWVSDCGLRLAVWEWGDADAPPLLLAHGGFDFAGTYDVFAPLLADAGWRVVSWDQRGHGDSDHAVLYSWDSDVRDTLAVLDSTTRAPIPFVGHSKGGSVVMQLAEAMPHRCTHLVNLDGLPSRRSWPDVPDHERTRMLASELRSWLDHRASASNKERKTGSIDDLAKRRQRMNPRLTLDWLRYLVPIGASQVEQGADEDKVGRASASERPTAQASEASRAIDTALWRWKLDPIMRFGGFGPWRPEWSMMRMPGLAMPVLGVLGLIGESMGWGTQPEDVAHFLPPGGTLVPLEDSGHFVHIEHPRKVADLVLDFMGTPPAGSWGPVGSGTAAPDRATPASAPVAPIVRLRHARAELALHELRTGSGTPILLLHGLAERSPETVPPYLADWAGPVFALDFVGHGASTMPKGGGYTAEMLLADADTALRHLGEATVLGRGLGAYVALLLAGARPDAVRGAILFDGPGILGGGTGPGPSVIAAVDATAPAPPDPFALAELSRDLRPPDYATSFVRLATQASALQHPITVASVNRPDWVEAVVREPGVLSLSLADALANYAMA